MTRNRHPSHRQTLRRIRSSPTAAGVILSALIARGTRNAVEKAEVEALALPLPTEGRNRLVGRIHAALEAMRTGHGDPKAWCDLVDTFNVVAQAAKELGEDATEETNATIVAAGEALGRAHARHAKGLPLAFDGPGLEAIREVVNAYDDLLSTITRGELRDLMGRTIAELERLRAAGETVVSMPN